MSKIDNDNASRVQLEKYLSALTEDQCKEIINIIRDGIYEKQILLRFTEKSLSIAIADRWVNKISRDIKLEPQNVVVLLTLFIRIILYELLLKDKKIEIDTSKRVFEKLGLSDKKINQIRKILLSLKSEYGFLENEILTETHKIGSRLISINPELLYVKREENIVPLIFLKLLYTAKDVLKIKEKWFVATKSDLKKIIDTLNEFYQTLE